MSGLTINQRPLTQKQTDILTYLLHRALPKGSPKAAR